jgi:hypothetical protein
MQDCNPPMPLYCTFLTPPTRPSPPRLPSPPQLIETKMELFKVCEKDTKTKTYSKEGLARAAKLDPEEQKKVDCNSWVLEMVDVMMQKVDEVRIGKYSEGGEALLILAAKI